MSPDIEIIHEGHGDFLVRPLTPAGEWLVFRHMYWKNNRGGVYFVQQNVEALIAAALVEQVEVTSHDAR